MGVRLKLMRECKVCLLGHPLARQALHSLRNFSRVGRARIFALLPKFDFGLVPKAYVLVVIYKPGKAVISAGMPKSRPWTVTRWLCMCLIQEACQALFYRPWIQGHLL